MKLIKCKAPVTFEKNESTVTIAGEVYQGGYDEDGNYYEHNLTTGEWFRLEFDEDN